MIRAVGRALAIFDAFDNDHLSLTLQQIAEAIRMPKTTAFRLVATLEKAGFLIRTDNQQYCLSLKLARLGGLVRSTLSIRDIARPVMLSVNEETSETVTLNTIVGTHRMVLEVVDTPAPLMSMARLGQQQPLLLGAAGRVLLAYMSDEERARVLAVTAAGVSLDRAAFDRDMVRIRRQGHAVTRGQRVAGLTAIAVPIFDMEGRVPHSLALTGPSVRIDARDHELAEIMVAAGRYISDRLGASPEHVRDLEQMRDDGGEPARAASPARRGARPVVAKPSATKPRATRKPAASAVRTRRGKAAAAA